MNHSSPAHVRTSPQPSLAGNSDYEKQTQQFEPHPWLLAHGELVSLSSTQEKQNAIQKSSKGLGQRVLLPANQELEPVNCTQQDTYQHHGAATKVSFLHCN